MNNEVLIRQLTNEERLVVNSEVEKQKKSPTVAYLLWFFFGFIGGHRYYMNKTGSAIAMTLIFFILSWFYFLGLLICAIWSIIDVFFINKWLKQNRDDIENKVAQDILYARNYHQQPEVAPNLPE